MKEKLKSDSMRSTLTLLALMILGAVAAVNLRGEAGIWVSLPLYPVCVAASCFLKVKLWQRVALFPLLTAVVNLAESDSPREILPYVGMAFLCLGLVTCGVYLLRKKEWRRGVAGGALIAAYAVCAFFVLGNPVTSFAQGARLNTYIDEHYGEGTHFSTVRIDPVSGNCTVTAYNEQYPTETAEIFLMGDMIVDHYKALAEQQATRLQAQKITDVLRKAFPGDSFTVYGTKIDGFMAEETVYSPTQSEISAHQMHFCVEIGAETNVEKYRETVAWYKKILDAYGLEHASVTFLGGTNFYYRTAILTKPGDGFFPDVMDVQVYVRRHPTQYGFLADRELPGLIP